MVGLGGALEDVSIQMLEACAPHNSTCFKVCFKPEKCANLTSTQESSFKDISLIEGGKSVSNDIVQIAYVSPVRLASIVRPYYVMHFVLYYTCVQAMFTATQVPCNGNETLDQTVYQLNYSFKLHTQTYTRSITGVVNATFKGVNDPNTAQFSVTLTITCSKYYYGVLCHSQCKEQDSNEFGHYTCDQLNGHKVCRQGYTDLSTNCTKGEKQLWHFVMLT